jgi:ABC-type phosphate transport system auxiliary subunit
MLNKKVTVIAHSFNGNVEEVPKFIEVGGQKFVADEKGQPKVGEDGKPVPYVETVPPKVEDLSNADLEVLAKVNPFVAKMLEDKKKLEDDLASKAKTEDEKHQKELAEKGEWQKLAEEREKDLATIRADLAKKEDMLGKYVGSVESVLKEVLATIPKENIVLIPADYSPRQKLEYITKNAKLLGAKMNTIKGDKVDKSDDTPTATDEEKLVSEIEEFHKRAATLTKAEQTTYYEKTQELKILRQKRLDAVK